MVAASRIPNVPRPFIAPDPIGGAARMATATPVSRRVRGWGAELRSPGSIMGQVSRTEEREVAHGAD
jgi:hypothetical protein